MRFNRYDFDFPKVGITARDAQAVPRFETVVRAERDHDQAARPFLNRLDRPLDQERKVLIVQFGGRFQTVHVQDRLGLVELLGQFEVFLFQIAADRSEFVQAVDGGRQLLQIVGALGLRGGQVVGLSF